MSLINKINKKQQNVKIGQKGQVLLFVIIAMTIALGLGTAISLRTLSSLSRVSTTDTSARALAAAEGGAENFLVKPTAELQSLLSVCTGVSAPECIVTFPAQAPDNIGSQATVTVQTYGDGSEYEVVIAKDTVREINLDGYGSNSIDICWNSLSDPVALYYTSYNLVGDSTKGGITPNESLATLDVSGFTGATSSTAEFDNCYTVSSLPSNPLFIRIRALGGRANVGIFGNGADLPYQGFEIISQGQIDPSGQNPVNRTVRVRRSLPYIPGIFDFGLYSQAGSID